MANNKYPLEYYQFFERFNQGEYYECHDLLEEIWMADKRNKFLQGLLQLAVGIYHFENGNINGARALFNSAYKYLKLYPSTYWDLDLEPITNYIEKALAFLPKQNKITIDEVKKINFPKILLALNQEL